MEHSGDTPLGRCVRGLIGPLTPSEANLLLVHLLETRSASHWDERACARIRHQVRAGRVNAHPNRNHQFVREYVARICGTGQGASAKAAADRWLLGSMERFRAAIRVLDSERGWCARPDREAYLLSVLVVCIFEANVASRARPSVPDRLPAPVFPGRPRP